MYSTATAGSLLPCFAIGVTTEVAVAVSWETGGAAPERVTKGWKELRRCANCDETWSVMSKHHSKHTNGTSLISFISYSALSSFQLSSVMQAHWIWQSDSFARAFVRLPIGPYLSHISPARQPISCPRRAKSNPDLWSLPISGGGCAALCL
jgi:hypothetical protein